MVSVPHESAVVPEQVISLTFNPEVKRSLMLREFLSSRKHFTLTPHFHKDERSKIFQERETTVT